MSADRTPLDVAQWVRETTAAQGLGEKVCDPSVLAEVASLLGVRGGAVRAHGALAPRTDGPGAHSGAPVGLHPVLVQAVPAGNRRRQDRRAG